MSSSNEQDHPKNRTGTADAAARKQNKLAMKEMVFSGIQAVGGAALAVYTYGNSSQLWPSMYSVIALGGTYNVIKNMRKIFCRSESNEGDESCSANNVATGTIIYFGSLYSFSEAWKSNHKLWIPCFGSAALGLYYAASSTYSKKTISTMKPLLKCCQLAFEPALIVGGATYLMRFRNHEEEWMYWLSLVAIGFAGLKVSIRGIYTKEDKEQPNIVLLKAIELLMGGCFLTVSSTILAIHVSKESWYESWESYATATEIFCFLFIFIVFGIFFIFGSIISFQHYVGLDREVAFCIGRMVRAPIVLFFACLIVKCMIRKRLAYTMFSFLAAWVLAVLWDSIRELRRILPRPVFITYCRRVLGPLLTVGSSAASAYIVYHYGFDSHYTRLMMPLVPYGIYVTYKGFSRMDESY